MRTLLWAPVILVVASLSLAETNKPPLARRSFYLRGSGNGSEKNLSTFKKVPRQRTQDLLNEFDVYALRKHGNDLWHPTEDFGCLLIADGELAIYFENMGEAAEFMSRRIDKVENSQRAEAILSLLPALFGYSIVTEHPPILRFEKPEEATPIAKDPEKWTRRFRQTKTGWELQCTLLFDPQIAFCNRVTLSMDKSGSIKVSDLEEVSSGPHSP